MVFYVLQHDWQQAVYVEIHVVLVKTSREK